MYWQPLVSHRLQKSFSLKKTAFKRQIQYIYKVTTAFEKNVILQYVLEVTFQVHLLWWRCDRWLTCSPPQGQSADAILMRIHCGVFDFQPRGFNANVGKEYTANKQTRLNPCLQQVQMQFCHIFFFNLLFSSLVLVLISCRIRITQMQ